MTRTRLPVLRFVEAHAPARRALGVVHGAQQAAFAVEDVDLVALVEGVVAGRDAIDAGEEQRVADFFVDAEAAGRVLAVDDDEIEREGFAQIGDSFDDAGAPRPADDVA